jgi:thiamine biosynthesis lipoprotein
MGTLVEISVDHRRREPQLHAAIDAAFASMERVHALMSFQEPDSELSSLNRHAVRAAQEVDRHTYAVFEAALRMAASSGGAFDPSIAPCLEEWGLLPRAPAPVDPAGNWRAIELLPGRRIRYAKPVRVDLGGIAKGYAVDLAVRSLQEFGLENIVVNAGGDLRVAGSHAHTVRLRHPGAPLHSAHAIDLCNAALATSADYFSRCTSAGGEVSALVNPCGLEPYLGGRSVSVRAENCMTADALTKVVMFAPAVIAETVLADNRAEAYVI